MTGPVIAVLDALTDGAGSLTEVRRRTGLRADVVRAAADHLVRAGRLQECPLAFGCPTDGCGGCALTGCARRS
ncbi:MAG: hypothetical protein QM582_13555 [Micropruina sp.]|uniref:hypothetical protein n=1 Tax=Micropruina sp. TaxID=2737536 RepID=UPI0039E5D606